ncbi:MAG: rhomboid family intramembrane serine protease [Crocinitomicaceae bacterium]|nr:rhomboid family intramembrane serine protease [Crocinitomicaceae bacterium]MBK9593111.1 rhomboid family intramembrane serine protease [Crocinitomicaceae bacterium]
MYITYLLLAVTILVSIKAFSDLAFRDKLLLNPHAVIHGNQSYRVFTHAFIHGDVMHLTFNMFALYLFAVQVTPDTPGNHAHYSLEPELISRYGPKGYLYFGALYLGGILFSTMWSLYKHRNNPYYNSLGASGAISAVIFAYILLNPMDKMGVFPFPPIIPAFIFGPLLLVFEYILAKRGGTGIAHDAHLAGALFGVIFITILDYRILLEFLRNFT